MAEVLVVFDAAIPGPGGGSYVPRACARVGDNGLWEGWLEFTDAATGVVVRSARETTQPTHADTMYWATGLSRAYLEGALDRALQPRPSAPARIHAAPAFGGPAPSVIEPADIVVAPRPVLDPFEVYSQGEGVLRSELLALSADHLRAIIRAYALEGGAGAKALTPEVLVEYIVAEVRSRAEARRADTRASHYDEVEGPAG